MVFIARMVEISQVNMEKNFKFKNFCILIMVILLTSERIIIESNAAKVGIENLRPQILVVSSL